MACDVRVIDPSGEAWDVSREWFGLPRWSRRRREAIDAADEVQGIPEIAVPDVAGVAFALVIVLILVLAWTVVVPALLLLAGILVAALALVARMISLQAWRIEARGRDRRLVWWCVVLSGRAGPCAKWQR